MESAPIVSIVIPTYNDERFIGEALASVFAQTYSHWEVIVVDDGSTDSSVQIAKGFGERVRVIEQRNSGSAVARNRGMHAARGAFIAFLDADDFWLPHKLKQQMDYIHAHAECGLVYCSWFDWRWPSISDPLQAAPIASATQQRETSEVDAAESGWIYPKLLLDCSVQTSTVLLRRSVMVAVGDFDEHLRRGQDYDFWLRCARVTPMVKLARIGSLYRLREDSITKRVHPVNYGGVLLERAVKTWGMQDPRGKSVSSVKVRRHISKVWRDFAVNHALAGNYKVARGSIVKALRWWPFDYIAWFCLFRYTLAPSASKDPVQV